MVLGVRPQLLSVMVPRLIKPPVTSTNLRALGALAEVAGGWLHCRSRISASRLHICTRHADVMPMSSQLYSTTTHY